MRSNSSRSFSAKKSCIKIFLYLILQMGHLERLGWHSLHTMWPEEENFTQIDFLVPHYGLSWGWCRYAVKKSLFTAYILKKIFLSMAKNINFNLKIFVTTPFGPFEIYVNWYYTRKLQSSDISQLHSSRCSLRWFMHVWLPVGFCKIGLVRGGKMQTGRGWSLLLQ